MTPRMRRRTVLRTAGAGCLAVMKEQPESTGTGTE